LAHKRAALSVLNVFEQGRKAAARAGRVHARIRVVISNAFG
jgi:hypothetical protein